MVVDVRNKGLKHLQKNLYNRQFKNETEKFTTGQVKDEKKKKHFLPKCQFWKCKKEDLNHWVDDFMRILQLINLR